MLVDLGKERSKPDTLGCVSLALSNLQVLVKLSSLKSDITTNCLKTIFKLVRIVHFANSCLMSCLHNN
jgi:hypothetical protein